MGRRLQGCSVQLFAGFQQACNHILESQEGMLHTVLKAQNMGCVLCLCPSEDGCITQTE